MKIEWDTPVDVLMHGANIDYIELDDDEIMHWKYVKKEKRPNGKWRYYYDVDQLKNDLGFDERDRMNKANADYKKATADAKSYQDYVTKEHYRLGNQWDDGYVYYTEDEFKHLQNLNKQKEEKLKKAEEAGKKASQATKEFYNTPLGKLNTMETKIKQGVKAVTNFFSKLFGK